MQEGVFRGSFKRLRSVGTESVRGREGNAFVIQGKEIETLMRRINFSDYESLSYFHLMLKKMGIDTELRRKGIKEGDIVRIFDWEFEYEE